MTFSDKDRKQVATRIARELARGWSLVEVEHRWVWVRPAASLTGPYVFGDCPDWAVKCATDLGLAGCLALRSGGHAPTVTVEATRTCVDLYGTRLF